jgi:hypothetical protein
VAWAEEGHKTLLPIIPQSARLSRDPLSSTYKHNCTVYIYPICCDSLYNGPYVQNNHDNGENNGVISQPYPPNKKMTKTVDGKKIPDPIKAIVHASHTKHVAGYF